MPTVLVRTPGAIVQLRLKFRSALLVPCCVEVKALSRPSALYLVRTFVPQPALPWLRVPGKHGARRGSCNRRCR